MKSSFEFHLFAKAWVAETYPGSDVICTNFGKRTVTAALVLDPGAPNTRHGRTISVP